MPSQPAQHKTRRLPSFPVLEQGLHAMFVPGRFGELRDEGVRIDDCLLSRADLRMVPLADSDSYMVAVSQALICSRVFESPTLFRLLVVLSTYPVGND